MTATTLSIEAGNVAQWVWRTSLEATLLIGVIFLIGWAAGRRLPPRWRYGLGLLILARLVLPITLPGVWGFNMLLPDEISGPRWAQGDNPVEQSSVDTIPPQPAQVTTIAPVSGIDFWSMWQIWAAGVFLLFGLTVVRMTLFALRVVYGAEQVTRTDSLQLLADCRACLGVTRSITMFGTAGSWNARALRGVPP